MKRRKRHDYDRDKKRLNNLNYDKRNIITKSFLAEEYPNDEQLETATNKTVGFYTNYFISLPINPSNELSMERI